MGEAGDRTPVIVGVGNATQAAGAAGAGVDALELMVRAARGAGADSGCPDLLGALDVVSVPEGSWAHANPAGRVAADLEADRARTVVVQVGIPQQTLLDDAFAAIASGEHEVVLVVGGEAAARSTAASRAGIELDDPQSWPTDPDELRVPEGEIVTDLEISAELWTPVEEYALIESALRFAEGRGVDEHRDDVAALWARFSDVAATNERAAKRTPVAASEIRDVGPGNRLLAFPYHRRHCSHLHVDQAAAILVTSLGRAQAAGVDPSRLVFPHVAAESSDSVAVIRRRDLHRWPAMRVLGEHAASVLGRPLSTVDHVELYSCFPAAVRVQQRELGLPVDGTPTITGGMPFAGGPWNSFVLEATTAMVERLRLDRGSSGLVTTVSGFLHKPGLAVYSTEPPAEPVSVVDLATDAAAATPRSPLAESHHGRATIVACTVAEDWAGERRVVTLLDTPAGERWIGFSRDPAMVDAACATELIGSSVEVDGFAITAWH